MRRIVMAGLGVWAVVALVAACGDEDPTDVGSDLMGPGVRTYEVTLEPSEFLVSDTTFDRIGTLSDAGFRLVAHEFDGELEGRTLFGVARPLTVTYTPGEGAAVTDSIQALVGGVLTIVVDTLATSPGPIDLEVVQVTEEWHAPSATWEVRIDSADVNETWLTPGGSPGPVMATGTWVSGDTLRIPIDSASIAVWDDSLVAMTGGMIRSTTPGSRLFIQAAEFRFEAVPTSTDTVLSVGQMLDSKIVVDPAETGPTGPVLRVGGLPAWRSLVRFQPLADVRIPCGPGQPAGCTLPLTDVTINQAALLLSPVAAGARRIERPVWLEARGVLEGPAIPVTRSPMTPPVGPPTDSLAVGRFDAPDPDGPPVSLPVTGYVRFLLNPSDDEVPPQWLALVAIGERTTFGYVTFGSLASDRPPRLRLVVSVPDEVLIR